ncbi:hypothetical protein L6164_000870 [Bauhinia variegata]|nr:hypothetical protein L6164_000870 [Bauhinia variegata]
MVHSRSLKPSNGHSLEFLQNLEGIQRGEKAKGLVAVRNYLNAFGYLKVDDPNNSNNLVKEDEFDTSLESAIKKFQQFYNLNVSGKLDSDTIKKMQMPRCGVADHVNYNGLNDLKYSFFNGTPKWPSSKFHLTYTFKSGVEVESLETMRYVFQQAFGKWSQVSRFTFEEAPAGAKADLVLGFYRGDHSDGYPFDGLGNTLAHAFAPMDGRLHFDADEQWSTDVPPKAMESDLISVAIHEVGHLLGLGHSRDQNAVMYASLPNGVNKRTLGSDDIAGIKALYSS